MATEETWEDVLRTNYTDLLKNIHTEFGLFGEMKKAKIFTPIALKAFWDCKSTTEKIDRLLQNLLKKDFKSFKKFCESLKDSDQEHIVREHLSRIKDVSVRPVTSTDSPSNQDAPHNRPISKGASNCFKQHWNELISDINFDEGLLAEIDKRGTVTPIQLTKLRDIELECKRTEQMLCWLERGSEKQFLDFCDALRANNQPVVVTEYLTPELRRNPIPEAVPSVIPKSSTKSPEDCRRNPEAVPSVIPKSSTKSPEDFGRDPEGAPTLAPIPIEVAIKDIRFLSCAPEFLNSVQAKVLKKIAYRCESKPRGRALIMNNKFFATDSLATRDGADVDSANLKALFTCLHFDTVVHSDLPAQEMWDILVAESREEHHKRYDMFVLFLLSHGIKGELYGLDGKSLKTQDIMNLFNGKKCPNLLTKPKLFFIQACQGEVKTAGVLRVDADGVTACDAAMPVQHHSSRLEEMIGKLRLGDDFDISIPLAPLPEVQCDAVAEDKVHEMADMAIIYATVEGYVAWRRVDTGSLFVQCLIDVLLAGAHETDLMRMITEAFNRLHQLEVDRYKQIGEKRDSLRGEVYLLP